MEQLPLFLNLRGRTVVLVGEGEAADAKARLIARAGGRIVTGALADLVQIRMDTASLAGVLPDRVPSLASRSDIGAVWVAGTRRAQNGRHLTIDTAGVLRDAIGALRDAS